MVGGQSGPWFYPKRGVHQGAPLSMILYIFYINDLLKDLSNCTSGLRIRSLRLTSPSHADDIAILALFKKSLNALLDIAYRYSLKWRYSYNMSKTTLIVWGPDLESNKDVVFGNCVLSKSDKCKHMGVTLHNDPKLSTELCSKRIGAGRKILLAARGIGRLKCQWRLMYCQNCTGRWRYRKCYTELKSHQYLKSVLKVCVKLIDTMET